MELYTKYRQREAADEHGAVFREDEGGQAGDEK